MATKKPAKKTTGSTSKPAAEKPNLPLAVVLEGHFETPFSKLPAALRQRVKATFPPLGNPLSDEVRNGPPSWGELSPEQRRQIAEEWGSPPGPVPAAARQLWDDLAEIRELEHKVQRLEHAAATSTGADRIADEAGAKEARERITEIEARMAGPTRRVRVVAAPDADGDARLLARAKELKRTGVKAWNKQLQEEFELSKTRVHQLLKRAERAEITARGHASAPPRK